MKRYLKVYLLFFKNSAMLLMSHRFSFMMSAVANIVWTITQVISLKFISTKISNFEGWSFGDLTLLLGFGQILVYSMFIIYDAGLRNLRDKIIAGEMDRYLTRPLNIKFSISFETVSIPQLIPMFTTIIPLIIYGLNSLENLNKFNILLALILNTISVSIFYFLSLAIVAFNFLYEDARTLKDVIFNSAIDFNRVPLTIIPKFVRYALTFVVPVAFATFYPVLIIKNEVNFVPIFAAEILVLIAMILFSKLMWSIGLKKYSGVG